MKVATSSKEKYVTVTRLFIAADEFEGHDPDLCSVSDRIIEILVAVLVYLNIVHTHYYILLQPKLIIQFYFKFIS